MLTDEKKNAALNTVNKFLLIDKDILRVIYTTSVFLGENEEEKKEIEYYLRCFFRL